MIFFDSFLAFLKLRETPEKFAKEHGGSGKKGKNNTLLGILIAIYCLQDLVRHYLVLFVTSSASILSFNVTNPINGNELVITNKQVMDASYFTGMIFAAQAVIGLSNSAYLKTTAKTKFIFTSK